MTKLHEKWWIVAPFSVCCTLGLMFLLSGESREYPPKVFEAPVVSENTITNRGARLDPAREMTSPRSDHEAGANYIRVPKGIVSQLYGSFYSEDGGVSESLAKALEIDDNQRAEINQCIEATLPELRQLEADHSQLRTDDDGNQFFEIAPFDGSHVRRRIEMDLKRILGDDRAVFLSELFGKSGDFSHFGKYPQEIAFEEISFDETGEKSMRLKVTFHTGGSNSSSYALAPGMKEVIRKRFGLLYERAGIPLQTE